MSERCNVRGLIEPLGADPRTNPPEGFSAYTRSEIAKWAKVVRDAGIAEQ